MAIDFGPRPIEICCSLTNCPTTRSKSKRPDRVLDVGQWHHLIATYDGSGKASGVNLYVDGVPQYLDVLKDGLKETASTTAPLEFGRTHPDGNPLRQTAFQDFRFYQRELSVLEASRLPYEDYVAEIARKPMSQWSEDELHTVTEYYFGERDARDPRVEDSSCDDWKKS